VSSLRHDAVRSRLLIVDDERHSFDHLRDIFAAAGYECEVALEVATALGILTERYMDVAVVNAALIPEDEEAMILEFKAALPEMGLLVFNGKVPKSGQRRLRRLGADSYLSAPSELRSIVRGVERLLDTRR
jgi:DNA-binding NtrC family response regulator